MNDTNLKDRNGEHPLGDAVQLILFVVFLGVWIADSFFLHRSIFLARYVPFGVRFVLLLLALIAAMMLFRSAGAVLHHGRRQDNVIETGSFRYVRHPLYLGVLFVYLGMVIATASLASLAAFAGIFVFYNYIASYEERLMEAWFGEAYKGYKARTGRWLPKIGKGR